MWKLGASASISRVGHILVRPTLSTSWTYARWRRVFSKYHQPTASCSSRVFMTRWNRFAKPSPSTLHTFTASSHTWLFQDERDTCSFVDWVILFNTRIPAS